MQEGGDPRIATVEIHPQTFQSFSSSPLSVFVPRSPSLNRTAHCDISAHIRAWTNTESCVRMWIDRALPSTLQAALADRLKLEGEMTKKRKEKRNSPLMKQKKNPKRPNIISPLCLLLRMTYIFYLLFLQNKLALWHGVTSKQSTSTLAAWSKGQDILL